MTQILAPRPGLGPCVARDRIRPRVVWRPSASRSGWRSRPASRSSSSTRSTPAGCACPAVAFDSGSIRRGPTASTTRAPSCGVSATAGRPRAGPRLGGRPGDVRGRGRTRGRGVPHRRRVARSRPSRPGPRRQRLSGDRGACRLPGPCRPSRRRPRRHRDCHVGDRGRRPTPNHGGHRMNALVVYESHWGDTETIAQAIAIGPRAGCPGRQDRRGL